MAMLLLRSGGLSGAQKVPLSSLTYTREGSIGGNMIEEENSQHPHQHRSSRSSRKSKNGQKKIPQRGLGVAQLEKLRLEEQQKQEAACLASLQRAHALPPLTSALHSQSPLHPHGNSLVFTHNCASQIKGRSLEQHPPFMSPTNTCKMSDSIISIGNPHSINFKQQMGLGSSNSSPRQESPREESRGLTRNRSSEVESSVTNVGAASSGFVSGSWPAQIGNGEAVNHFLNQEMDARKANMFSSRFQNSSSHPNKLKFFEPLIRSPASSRKLPMVSISSSGATIQLEPPSNQSYSTTPLCNEEDRIAGMKRPWPFSQEIPTSPIQSKATCLNVGIGIHLKSEDIGNSNIDRLEAMNQESPAIFRNSLGISLGSLKKKTTWQANSELTSPGDQHHSEISFSCDSGRTPKEIEIPGGSFLALGLPHPTDGVCHGNEYYYKTIQHFSSSEASDECGLPNNPSIHLYQETSGGLSTTSAFPSNGLLKHGSFQSADFRHHEEQSVPFYKFLHTLSDQGTADFICLDKKVSNRDPKESIDLNLRLSL